MGVPARAAVEAPEGGRAPKERAAAPIISRRQRLLMVRGQWLACAFRRFASLLPARDLVRKPDTTFRDDALLPEANLFLRVVVGTARTHRRRENDLSRRHCRA
jgi:hypothetical protein